MEMAEADWHNALDALISAYEETAAAEADVESLEAQEEGAQEAVDEIQEKLDEFMEKHVFVNGVGGDPSAGPNHVVYKGGPNHVVYKGVHMYFSNANMLMNVFDLIKEGIDKLANSLAEAKADLEAIQESLESARERLEAAEAAEAEAEANEQEAWEAYENANDFYIDALVDYMLCLADRAACLDEYPEECAGESLEPGGSSGSGGSDGKSASGNQNHKQPDPGDDDEEEEEGPVQPYSLDELTSGLDALLLLTTQNLAEQELMTDRLMAGVIGTRKCLDEVFAELQEAIVEAGEKAMASEALVSAMPDSSWILTVYAVPDSDYEVKEHGSLFIYYPSGSEAEIDDWLIEYEDELEEFAKPAEFMPVDLANAIDGLSNSLEAYNHGIGLVAGYSSMVESLTEYSGMLNELVDTASKTLSENNSNIQEVMDDLNALRAEAEELGH
jgi:peptidoglycan hydrolase CwlO-like protein